MHFVSLRFDSHGWYLYVDIYVYMSHPIGNSDLCLISTGFVVIHINGYKGLVSEGDIIPYDVSLMSYYSW